MATVIKFVTFILLAIFAAGHLAHADRIWDYNSNDGTNNNIATGRLTTTGLPGAELAIGTTFTLKSIDSAFFNGVDISVAPGWRFGAAPPFNRPFGFITTVAPGMAVLSPGFGGITAVHIQDNSNFIHLAEPGVADVTSARFAPGGVFHYNFTPVSTTFSAVPEPSAFLCLGLTGVGLLGSSRRKHCRGSRESPDSPTHS